VGVACGIVGVVELQAGEDAVNVVELGLHPQAHVLARDVGHAVVDVGVLGVGRNVEAAIFDEGGLLGGNVLLEAVANLALEEVGALEDFFGPRLSRALRPDRSADPQTHRPRQYPRNEVSHGVLSTSTGSSPSGKQEVP